MRVERCDEDLSSIEIGVCDAAARCSWGLGLRFGDLIRSYRHADGNYDAYEPPPDGYPDGRGQQAAAAICNTRGLLDALQALAVTRASDGAVSSVLHREVATMSASIAKTATLLLRS